MQKAVIYHNPRCSKSRETLVLLEDKQLDIEIIKYLDTPPSAAELLTFCERMGKQPSDIIRHKEARFKELGLSLKDPRSAAEWCEILAQNPVLIERPIVCIGDKAALGRPPENVLEIVS